jgi:rubrerythrin
MIDCKQIDTVETFLALSLLMEYESADRLKELSAMMRQQQAEALAELLLRLSGYSRRHAEEIHELAEGRVLPELLSKEAAWEGLEGPETTAFESVNPRMSTLDMLRVALRNETRGQDFYTRVSLQSPDPEVRRMAAEFAAEENEHVMMLQQWVEREESESA